MGKMLTKAQVVDHLAKKADLTKKQAAGILDTLQTLAAKEAKNGFVLPGFGKLVLANRKARMGRNPQTGQAIKIPAKRVLRFRIAKAMKDAVLGKK
ncbi:MAG TPA: HU family DNA-binding protein [bacterium]|nr:HU family DNA-binding protein [bacterium]